MTDEQDLVAAVKANDAATVRAILARDPFVARTATPNGTVVLTAKYYGADAALEALLEHTAEDRLNLYEASALGRAGRLKTILGQSRTRVDEPNAEGFTPLGLAAFFGNADAVRVLLDHGAAVDRSDRSRFANTALDAAAAANHADVVRILLAAGAPVNVRDSVRATPLHKAAQHGNAEVVRMLLEKGADVTAVGDDGATPLAYALAKDHGDVAALLRAHGATA